jgi:hypothetical protein
MFINEGVLFVQIFQGNIDTEVEVQMQKALNTFSHFVNKVVSVTTTTGKVVSGVITNPPIDLNKTSLRLRLNNYNAKNYKVEERIRVIPVLNIVDIKIIGEFNN